MKYNKESPAPPSHSAVGPDLSDARLRALPVAKVAHLDVNPAAAVAAGHAAEAAAAAASREVGEVAVE